MTEMVPARGVRKSFGDTEVLCGVDTTVARGEVACLLGPSGSGKSTFLCCVNRLERPSSGAIYVDGELIGYRTWRTVARGIERRARGAPAGVLTLVGRPSRPPFMARRSGCGRSWTRCRTPVLQGPLRGPGRFP